MLDYRVLGPFDVRTGSGAAVPLGRRKQRLLLAALLLNRTRPMPTERLIDLLWGGAPPMSAASNLHAYLSNLRRALAAAEYDRNPIRSQNGRYELVVRPEQVDADRFSALVEDGLGAAGRDEHGVAAERLSRALGLWRSGTVLEGLQLPESLRDGTARLEQLRIRAIDGLVSARLALGEHEALVPELEAEVKQHPLHEPFWAHLMLALYRSGRQADALAAFRRVRAVLDTELAVEPGPELQRLQHRILAGDPSLAPPAAPAVRAPDRAAIPAQLPADLWTFTGRDDELAQLERLVVKDRGNEPPTAVVISAIDGMAGVGKTALAVCAGHRLAPTFPDGQIFVDLHGFTEGVAPLDPANALDWLLRALGVPGEQIPHKTEARAALFRSQVADRRLLIVLDNAATEAQVRPLLPGAPSCLVLITSRRRLTGLDEASPLSLDVLMPRDAMRLFADVVGEHRLAGEQPSHLEEVVELCGRLPLAVRIAAARLRARPAWTLADLLGRLRDERHRLAELTTGERSVAAAFQLSYRHLDPGQQRMFRLLGLHPGADFDVYAAAALADTTLHEAEQLLEALLDAHLLQQHVAGRYRFHDLIRAYAASAVAGDESQPACDAALTRLFDHYRHAAVGAADLYAPHEKHRLPDILPPDTPAHEFTTATLALAWLNAERANLLAVAEHAAEHAWPTHACHLSTTLWRYLGNEAHHAQALALYGHAVRAARRHGDRAAEGQALRDLGALCRWLGHYHQALDYLQQAAAAYRETGAQADEARAINSLGGAYWRLGRHSEAVEHMRRALVVFQASGQKSSEANARNALGIVLQEMGRTAEALDHHRQALVLYRDIGNRNGEGYALLELGIADRRLSRYSEALDHHRQVLAHARDVGERNMEFEALHGLGETFRVTGERERALAYHRDAFALIIDLNQPSDEARAHDALALTYRDLGQLDQASEHWEHALAIYTDLGAPEATEVRTHLEALRHK